VQAKLAPEPEAELGIRIAEAEEAAVLARTAGLRLLANLEGNETKVLIATDFDRLEAAAFDLERRVLASRDAADRCGNPVPAAGKIGGLAELAASWVGYVQANRTSSPAVQLHRLRALLRQTVPGASPPGDIQAD
jgi:hypothetical protein